MSRTRTSWRSWVGLLVGLGGEKVSVKGRKCLVCPVVLLWQVFFRDRVLQELDQHLHDRGQPPLSQQESGHRPRAFALRLLGLDLQ